MIAAAGAIPLLVQLLQPDTNMFVQKYVALVLMTLAMNAGTARAVASGGAIPPLGLLMMASSCREDIHKAAAQALIYLVKNGQHVPDNLGEMAVRLCQ
ncbi:hypothetical protein FOA52_006549 [Chlamydomonas sp. UWO 241]|nr:hypothetical protein FOA52_006549 [Chlamydomonas sp. UWO 241]